MKSFFEPTSIAVAGVSPNPDKLASIIFSNLQTNARKGLLKASLYAINPAHQRIGEVTCYPSVRSLPEAPELLIMAVPAASTLQLVNDAADAGVKAAVMIPGGFAEIGATELQKKVLLKAKAKGMRILGPNTIGLVDTRSGVDSLFIRSTKKLPDGSEIVSHLKPLKGGVVVVTQSGHLGETVSEELAARGVGMRALVGTGNQLDVSVEEIIGYFADDEQTKVIAVYLEGLSDGRRFMKEASTAARRKPVVVFKVGKTQVGARAALTHTASLVGDYVSYEAAFRQSGLVEARTLEELIDLCMSFSLLPRVGGKRLMIITNAGGVGAIAADEAMESGLDVSPPSRRSTDMIRRAFRTSSFIPNASLSNPIDLTASAITEEFVRMTEIVLGLAECDMVLIMPTHQTPSIDPDVAVRLAEVVSKSRKPVAAAVMGWSSLANAINADFVRSGIPSFPTPERGARALAAAAAYMAIKPSDIPGYEPSKKDRLRTPRRRLGTLLPAEATKILTTYGISEPKYVVVRKKDDLAKVSAIGYPVACKLLSLQLLHKTDAGGVVLGVGNKEGVAAAFSSLKALADDCCVRFDGMMVQKMVASGVEIILGGTVDPTFGPTVLFGAGGKYAELIRDYSLAIAPVNESEAKEMILRTKLSPTLKGYRSGPTANIDRLAKVVSRFSRIMVEDPLIREIEINPLIVSGSQALAVDTRILASG